MKMPNDKVTDAKTITVKSLLPVGSNKTMTKSAGMHNTVLPNTMACACPKVEQWFIMIQLDTYTSNCDNVT